MQPVESAEKRVTAIETNLTFTLKLNFSATTLIYSTVFRRWLTDFVVNSGVEGLECLVKCKGGVSTFLRQRDLLDLCERVLRVSK